jgi:hypothetical protein
MIRLIVTLIAFFQYGCPLESKSSDSDRTATESTSTNTAETTSTLYVRAQTWLQPGTKYLWGLPLRTDSGTSKSWSDANALCNILELSEFDDWRLPLEGELTSAYQNGIYADVASDRWAYRAFWSQTQGSDSGTHKAVRLKDGEVESRVDTSSAYVFCVRGVTVSEETVETSASAGSSTMGSASTSSTSNTVSGDSTGPSISFLDKPLNPTTSNSAYFRISSNEALADTTCKLNYTIEACSADSQNVIELTLSFISDGTHTFTVEVEDAAGNKSSLLSHTWKIDTTAPGISFDTEPTDNVVALSNNQRSGFFELDDNGLYSDTIYHYKINSGSWITLAEDDDNFYPSLSSGTHTIYAKSSDSLGNTSSIISTNWTILPRFYSATVNGDTVIKSNVSGINGWLSAVFAADTKADASNGCLGLTYGGMSDWRLPSKADVENYTTKGIANFGLTGLDYELWTITYYTTIASISYYYTHNFDDGTTSYWNAASTRYIRCVRP